MEASFQITEDSRSIMQFMKPNKSDVIRQKKQAKQAEVKRVRKNSTQLSLFGWLSKSRPKQTSELARLPKDLIVCVYSYLRLSEILVVSKTCFSFYECARSIWSDQDFFKELQTDKLSEGQLRSILQKGGKMSHIRQLRSIYMGKNLKSCRQKIKVKVHDTSSMMLKPTSGNLLEVFEVSTRSHKSSAFLMDNHLQQIINSSYKSLKSIKLQACRYLRKFYDLSKCHELVSLIITENSYLTNEDIRLIAKNCSKIQILDLSGCDGLDQGLLKIISKLINLRIFTLNNYHQPFGDMQCLKSLTCLVQVNLENCYILDLEALILIKQLPNIQHINLCGCQLLSDLFLQSLMNSHRNSKFDLKLGRNNFSAQAVHNWQKFKRDMKTHISQFQLKV